MSESTPEQPEEPKRPDVARAFTASVRQSGEKRSPAGYLLTACLALVLAGAVALGVGAIVFHKRTPPKTVNAADRQRGTSAARTPGTPAGTPVPVRPGAPVPVTGPVGAGGKKTDGKTPATKQAGHGSKSSAGSSGGQVKAMAAVPTVQIVSYASGRCMDVQDGNTANGTPVQIWTCNGGAPQQRWSFQSGTIRSMGVCLTVAGPSSNGAPVQVAHCNGGSAQKFRLNSAADIVHSGTSMCLDVKDQNTADGTRLQLWQCGGTSNQKWHTG